MFPEIAGPDLTTEAGAPAEQRTGSVDRATVEVGDRDPASRDVIDDARIGRRVVTDGRGRVEADPAATDQQDEVPPHEAMVTPIR